MRTQFDLFLAFFRIGIFGFGGGPTMIPLVHTEVVDRYQWMDDDEFSNVLAIGNTLPGPIATKMAGYIGYKTGGYLGMLLAIIAVVIPLVVVMIAGLSLLNQYRDRPWVAGMANGVVPVVTWMLTKLTWDFYAKGYKSLGVVTASIMCVVAFLLIQVAGIHPGLVIAAILLAALCKPSNKSKAGKKNASNKQAE